MWSIYVMFFLLPVIPNQKSGVHFIEKTIPQKIPCFVDSQKNHCFRPIQPTHRGWHNIANTRCPKSRLYNFNALEFDAVYSSIHGNYRPGSKPPGGKTEAVFRCSRVLFFFCLFGNGKGVVGGWKGGFRGVDYFSEFRFYFCIWVIDALMVRWTFKIV